MQQSRLGVVKYPGPTRQGPYLQGLLELVGMKGQVVIAAVEVVEVSFALDEVVILGVVENDSVVVLL